MKIHFSADAVKPVVSFLKRFHAIIFFLIVSACLFVAIFLLLPITNISADKSHSSGQTVDDTFDQATIDRLRSGATASPSEPGKRPSPFTE